MPTKANGIPIIKPNLRELAQEYLDETVQYQEKSGSPAIYGTFIKFAQGRDDIGIVQTATGSVSVPLSEIIHYCRAEKEAKSAALGTSLKNVTIEDRESEGEKSSDSIHNSK